MKTIEAVEQMLDYRNILEEYRNNSIKLTLSTAFKRYGCWCINETIGTQFEISLGLLDTGNYNWWWPFIWPWGQIILKSSLFFKW